MQATRAPTPTIHPESEKEEGRCLRRSSVVRTAKGEIVGSEPDAWIFDPTDARIQRWSAFTLLLLLYTATVTPFEACFMQDRKIPTLLAIFSGIVDIGFALDMTLQFNLCLVDEETQALISDRCRIVKTYLSGWFLIDLVSVLPFGEIVGAAGGDGSNLKLLQVVRLLRLAKLLKLVRGLKVLSFLLQQSGLSFTNRSLLSILCGALVMLHLMACFWRLLPTLFVGTQGDFGGEDELTWLDDRIISRDYGESANWEHAIPLFFEYQMAFNFCLRLVGCYDGDTVLPRTRAEYTYTTLAAIFAFSVYTWMLGHIVRLLTQGDPALEEYRTVYDTMMRFCRRIGVSKPEQDRVREYLEQAKEMMANKFYSQYLRYLSPELQGILAKHSVGWALAQVPFFDVVMGEFALQNFTIVVARTVGTVAYSSDELIYRPQQSVENLHIIMSGVVAHGMTFLGKKRVFGLEFVSRHAKTRYMARSITHTDCHTLSRTDLLAIVETGNFPEIAKRVQRARVGVLMKQTLRNWVTALRLAGKLPPRTAERSKELQLYRDRIRIKTDSDCTDARNNVAAFDSVKDDIIPPRTAEDGVDPGMAQMEHKIDLLSERLDAMQRAADARFNTMIGLLKQRQPHTTWIA